MSNGNGHHWSKFAWRDWSGDKALHSCTIAARGFWVEVLCIMHEGDPVGHLTMNGRPATLRQIASSANVTEKEALKLLAELDEAGVFSRTPDGTIYCRRMVRDAAASEVGRTHAEKRWNASHPNGPPNGGATNKANGVANGTPNAKNLESEKEPPLSPPLSRGGRSRRGISWKSGAHELIFNEGLAALEQPASNNVTAIDAWVAVANVPRRVAR